MRDANQKARDAFMAFSIKLGAVIALAIVVGCVWMLINR